MSYTFSQPIFDSSIRKINSLITVMSRHANLATRGSRNTWRLTWHFDRIDVTFHDELDWKHFDENFLDKCLEDLAYRDLIPDAEMTLHKLRGADEAREVLGGIADRLRTYR